MGIVYAIGIGPGLRAGYTEEAAQALEACELVVGYRTYADLVRKHFPDKEYFVSGMRQEAERCQKALEEAAAGRTVAVVCSGDAGVYGMAGLLFELAEGRPDVEIRVVPGVTAALSGAAVLGAPLSDDFCTISLSDHLTPWEEIETRLRAAAAADFAVCLYNPSSKARPDYLARACRILRERKPADTVCGYVRNIGREGQEHKILTLAELETAEADMFTTVFVGTRRTVVIGDRMVTRRGYRHHGI